MQRHSVDINKVWFLIMHIALFKKKSFHMILNCANIVCLLNYIKINFEVNLGNIYMFVAITSHIQC